MARFHTLKIQSIVRQTKKAISITFLVPSSLKSEFVFKNQSINQSIKLSIDQL